MTQVTDCSYVPMLMHRTEKRSGFALLDAYAALEETGDQALRDKLTGAIDLCRQVLGEEFDRKEQEPQP